MQEGDTQTITIKKAPNFTFTKTFEREWLEYMGFTEKELGAPKEPKEISLTIRALKNGIMIEKSQK